MSPSAGESCRAGARLGGTSGVEDRLRSTLESLAVHVKAREVDDCRRYVMEEQPARYIRPIA